MAKRKQPNGDGGMKTKRIPNPKANSTSGRLPDFYGSRSARTSSTTSPGVPQIRPGWRPGDEYYGDLDDFNTRDSNEPLNPRSYNQKYTARVEFPDEKEWFEQNRAGHKQYQINDDNHWVGRTEEFAERAQEPKPKFSKVIKENLENGATSERLKRAKNKVRESIRG